MKIYTRKGDMGQTSLVDGSLVPKHDRRVECYGTVDELNSFIGLCINQLSNSPEWLTHELVRIQNELFVLGSHLATPTGSPRTYLPELNPNGEVPMESSIDRMQSELPILKNFILPGGSGRASHLHCARSICRRAERRLGFLYETEPSPDVLIGIRYLNRLSDYLFVAARYCNMQDNHAEVFWKK